MENGGGTAWRNGRRRFLAATAGALLAGLPEARSSESPSRASPGVSGVLRLFLAGDVMTGRGIDQIQRQPGDPRIYERYLRSALKYVQIAEEANGPIPRRVAPGYIWGDALDVLDRVRPQARIVNLETAITTAPLPWPDKPIQYRMNPANVACLGAARLDCCTIANNHVLDWGFDGLEETLSVLHAAGLRTAGAGRDAVEAATPAVVEAGGPRVLVFAYGSPSAGVPPDWAARSRRAGVNLIDEADPAAVERVARDVRAARRAGDVVVASVHMGGNWGYEVPPERQGFARRLIDEAGVDVVFGHSSHHPRPIECYHDKLILYGCGDLLNDYEGIGGHEEFRPDLTLMYFPEIDARDGRLRRLELIPMRLRKFRLERAAAADGEWLRDVLTRAGRPFGTRLEHAADGALVLART